MGRETVGVKNTDVKQKWPFTTGRQHFAAMQIVGLVCASGSLWDSIGVELGDEVAAIERDWT
jgi:hypothetical protein